MNTPKETLCKLLGCTADQIQERRPGTYVVAGKIFFLTGGGLPSGLPDDPGLSKMGEWDGYSIYVHQ